MTEAQSKCCVCLEYSDNQVQCKQCRNATVCAECLAQLVSCGKHQLCPVCRQPDWNNTSIYIEVVEDEGVHQEIRSANKVCAEILCFFLVIVILVAL